jgi:WD40 repeat protein
VLRGVALFVAKLLLIPDAPPTTNIAVDVSNEPETTQTVAVPPPPEDIAPIPAVPETGVAQDNSPPKEFPALTTAPEQAVPSYEFSPFEEATHMILPPGLETQGTAPETETAHSSTPPPLTPSKTPDTPETLLEAAKTALAENPEESIQQAVRAAKMYEEQRQPVPDSLYWIMGNARASLSWGESLLESSPAIETMTLSADNRYLLAQLRDKSVWLWDLQCPEEERAGYLLDRGTEEYVRLVFSPDLRWIIGGQKNGMIRVWDMSLRKPAETLISFVERVPDLQDLQISPNGHWLVAFGNAPQPSRPGVSDSSPYPVLLWNLRQMETAGVVPMAIPVPLEPQPIQILRFSPNSDRLAIGTKDAAVRIYDITTQGAAEEPLVLQGHQLGITQIVFAPNGEWIATGGQDNTVRLWNLNSPKDAPESTTLLGHIGWISALTIDQTGEYILSGSYDRTIRVWNVKQSRIATAMNVPPIILKTNLGIPESLAITRDGDKMIVLGSGGTLGIYHLPSLLGDDESEDFFRAVTFRNSKFSISKNLLTTDDQLLIFSYEDASNPLNNGIRLWALQSQSFVR